MKITPLLGLMIFALIPFDGHSQNFSANATSANDFPGLARASQLIDRPAAPQPGRLFFAPAKRQGLDQQRRTLQYQETVVEGDTLSLNGVVTRSTGRWTMWINGTPVSERDGSATGVAPTRDGGGRLSAGGATSRPLVVSVGDSVERASGQRSSPLGEGRIRVHSRSSR